MTTIVSITRKRGDTRAEEVTIIDEDTLDALPISGSFILSVSTLQKPTAASYVFQITGAITDGPNGVVEFPFTSGEDDNVGDYFYDIQMLQGGIKDTVMEGSFTMVQDITKD